MTTQTARRYGLKGPEIIGIVRSLTLSRVDAKRRARLLSGVADEADVSAIADALKHAGETWHGYCLRTRTGFLTWKYVKA